MREIALFSGKIYTAGTNFTRPLVVTVATNLNSDDDDDHEQDDDNHNEDGENNDDDRDGDDYENLRLEKMVMMTLIFIHRMPR